MPRGKIVVVGSSNMDMIILTEHLPARGETVLGNRFQTSPGGKGANQAVAAARGGSAVQFVANLGNDVFGHEMIANFRRERVGTDHVTLDRKNPSGVAMIMVDAAGENVIAVAPGANALLTPDHIDKARESIRLADFCLLQMEIPRETICHAIETAWRENTAVALNAAPVPAEPLPEDVFRKIEILIVNENEAGALSGVEVSDGGSAEKAARVLQEMGAARVIITLGGRGALAVAEQPVFTEAVGVEVVDTVGAGDAFCGALVLAASVRFAAAAAALACTKVGAQASLPARTDIESLWRR
ncbi:MAG: ribokinase [Planctomycetota bacterium]|jgi:ribokinase